MTEERPQPDDWRPTAPQNDAEDRAAPGLHRQAQHEGHGHGAGQRDEGDEREDGEADGGT